MVATPSPGESARYSDGSFSESEDIYMTINTDRGPEFYGVEPPRAGLTKDFSQNERQISVDPISLQESTNIKQGSFRLVSPPTLTPDRGPGYSPPVPSPPSTLSYVSTSLSSSASSSPQSTSLVKKIWKSQNSHKKSNSRGNRSGSQSTFDDTHRAETNQKRSLSLGEGRRSSTHADEFNLGIGNTNNQKVGRVQSKPPLGPSGGDRLSHMKKSKSKDESYPDDGFKCGKLCLFLPKGKGKPVRSISGVSSTHISIPSETAAISRTVSMERFECGSWSSSLHEDNEGDSANLFFDLPMEMLRCSVSDMQSPVTAAFVFDNENENNNDQDIKAETLMHP